MKGMDVAIVGMACRFPGARNYDEFWRNVAAGRNSVREVPSERWDWRAVASAGGLSGHSAGWGGFIEDVDKFDPLFFGISPTEAAFMDPQHRLFLETAWHAVEDAGYGVSSLGGRAIGVYAGVSKNDYAELMRERGHPIVPYVSTGTVHSILANRVSFLFNWVGRSEAVDTACSSSLVALHNAMRDMRAGECEAALVGGVNALISPTMFVSHSKSGMLSADGQCKTFSAGANGYVRAEGVGVLFVKPLERALEDRDHVHAVIKGSAINHGGRANFLTSPTTEAQAAVVAKALRAAGVDPHTVGYVEAHGTGTPLGDPIEINGLKRAFAQVAGEPRASGPSGGHRCALGSVKTNVGHLESASGMAGLIKAVMAMQKRQIPALANFTQLNPYIELDGSPFYVPREPQPWTAEHGPRRAGVSSFGMGGVNAHVVLEEAPARARSAAETRRTHAVPLSTRKGRLRESAAALSRHLKHLRAEDAAPEWRDVAFTLQSGRDVFEERLAVVASSVDELIEGLDAHVNGAGGVIVAEGAGQAQAAERLARRFVQGEKVAWVSAAGEDGAWRVPLPTYPFARKRCWFSDAGDKSAGASRDQGALAPITAGAARGAPGTARTVRPADFFVRDHVVQGRRTVPGVMHLELARAAAEARGDVGIVTAASDVYWMTPIVVDGDVPLEVKLTGEGAERGFEVRHGEKIFSKGKLICGSHAARAERSVDLAEIEARCGRRRGHEEIYALLRRSGLDYGPTFRALTRCAHSDHEIVAALTLPRECDERVDTHTWHPSLLDGVFQAVTLLSVLGLERTDRQYVPFSLEAVKVLAPIPERAFVHATVARDAGAERSSMAFNAALLDAAGHAVAIFTGLQKRPLADAQADPRAAGGYDVVYRPAWRRRQPDARAAVAAGGLVIFGDGADVSERVRRAWGEERTLAEVRPGDAYRRLEAGLFEIAPAEFEHYERLFADLRAGGVWPTDVAYLWGLDGPADDRGPLSFERSLDALLGLTQAAFKARLRDGLHLAYVYRAGQLAQLPAHALASGFARTLKYENPGFSYVTLGLDDAALGDLPSAVCAELHAASLAAPLRDVLYQGGSRHERVMLAEALPGRSAGDATTAVKTGGVYVISGGAGGLGLVFSRHFARTRGATIVWLGRSPSTPAIAGRVDEIVRAGGRCDYHSVDVTDASALERVLADVRRVHGRIDGVLHAAAVVEDAFILRKERAAFARVVAPKVDGVVNLDRATRHDELDFFVAFSSIAALMPNQGQSAYAAGNSFLDSFSEARNARVARRERSGVSLSFNWPLWAEGGIRVSADEERHLFKAFGMRPMSAQEGLEVFERALVLARRRFPEIHQLAAVTGDAEAIERCLGVSAAGDGAESGAGLDPAALVGELRTLFADHLGLAADSIEAARPIGEFGITSSAIVDVIERVNECFGAQLKPTVLFDVNTLDKLAEHLAGLGHTRVVARPRRVVQRWNRSLIDLERSDPAAGSFSRTFKTAEFYLRDHVVDGQYNMPGACYVEMARQAGAVMLGERVASRLLNNYWASPLSSPGEDFEAQVQISPKHGGWSYEIASHAPNGQRRLHATGEFVETKAPRDVGPHVDLDMVMARCAEVRHPARVYEQILAEGLVVAATFRPMRRIHLGAGEALAELELTQEARPTGGDFLLHPALLTGAFQAALVSNKQRGDNGRRYIPIGIDRLEVYAALPAECWVHSRAREANAKTEELRKFDLEICGRDGVVVARLEGFAIRALKESRAAAEPGALAVGEVRRPETGAADARRVGAPARASALGRARQEPSPGDGPSAGAAALSEARVREAMHAFLRALMAKPIGLQAEELDARTGFDEYGVNSVMVVELNEALERCFGSLSKTLFFEYRNVDELAQYFLDQHGETALRVLREAGALTLAAPAEPAPAAAVLEHGSGAAEHDAALDVAIVAAAGRFPGARDLEEFWDVLRTGRDCITEIPDGLFDGRYFDADPDSGRIYGRWGGFLDDVDCFDPAFFGISPREAELIDPQERLLLEVVWETFERAGYTRERLVRQADKRVGVFVGALWQPYESAGIEATLAGNVVGPSSLLYSIANRVSFFFDFSGPSLAIDTACSSSLTALHLACQSIRSGECRSALVAGVNLSRSASKYLFLARNRFLSTDGRCRSYGAGGDGYVPGEGVCALYLKPLTQAVADGDVIRAVIKGTAVNHGGRTNGYTVPSPRAQGSVIAAALQAARVDPRAITYMEGHGTGTALGDPIEIDGLKKALSVGSGRASCAIGSVKSNIGHLEAAAGVASVIKVLLQLDHGQLVPSLHADRLNPNIDFGEGLFVVQRTLQPWPRAAVARDGTETTLARCAGVSSFGAGGSNAHAILQQYDGAPPELASATRPGGPALCVFSARSDERLKALLTRFGAALAKAPALELHDVAYTLQLGREALRERLAIVAESLEELRRSLDDFLAGRGEGRAWSRGRAGVGPARPTPAREPRRGETRDQLLRLADEWLAGGDVDWSELYGGRNHRFLTLPTYPFARERYWIEGAAPAAHGAAPVARAVVTQHGHPLAQRNTSDLEEQRYSSTFDGGEFFLADHRVRTDGAQVQAVLPGVAYLEMARAALVQASPRRPEGVALELRAVVWAQPLVVAAPTDVHVALSTDDSGEITYDVYSETGGEEVLHSQGRAAWQAEAPRPRLDLHLLRRRMDQGELPSSEVYAAFAGRGLHLGPSFRAIERVLLGRDELLSELRLPAPVAAGAQEYELHPSLMDGALQGSLGLLDGWQEAAAPLRVPFALESLTVLAPCNARMLAWVRRAPESGAGSEAVRVDVDLCDEDGLLCARVRGFATCALEAGLGAGRRRKADDVPAAEVPIVAPTRGEAVTLTAVWDALEPDLGVASPRRGQRVLVFGGNERRAGELASEWGVTAGERLDERATVEELQQALRGAAGRVEHVVWLLPEPAARTAADESVIADQERGVVAGFRLVQALLREGYGARDLAWTVITSGTESAGGRSDASVDPTHASVHGLIGSMAKEYAHWQTRLVDLPVEAAWPWAELLRLRPDARGDAWSQRRGQWYRRRLVRCGAHGGEVAAGACRFKPGGTYVLIGGAGGVGQAVSAHLIKVYGARLVWIGRRAEDAAIASGRARAAAEGGEPPLYVAADARRRDALEAALLEIKTRVGRIDGVIHAAIVLSDKSLAQMDEEQFRASLSAKIDTAVRVEQVFGGEPLDFILYLSSLQTFLKAPGQGNYSAGCTFVDAFADWQASRAAYPVKVMSWGYWGSVGVVAGPEYGARMARLGWGSIEPEEGVAALERLLTGPLRQAGFVRALHAGALDVLGVAAGERLERAAGESPAACASLAAEGLAAERPRPAELLAWRERLVETDRALLTMLRWQLEALGGPDAIEAWDAEDWIARAGVAREHERWLRESRRLLSVPGARAASHVSHAARPGAGEAWWREWERAKAGWERRNPGCTAQLKLVEAALHGLGDVLRGRKRATDVLFPDSSLTLVEAVYKHNVVADHFHAVVADVLLRHVAATTARQAGRRAGLRVLELGAGTGGTTGALLPVLDTCGVEISEYLYTDVSRLFLVHGEQAYAGARRYLKFALANVDDDLEAQGIAPGAYDVVVAANVLHATRRLRQTLRHAKAALKTNGLLLLDEISTASVFRHLTFGLLAGWWAYEDDALRMEGNPGLTPGTWQRVLEDEGFHSVWFPAESAHDLGQQVVVAESDGWTRRRERIAPAARGLAARATAAPDPRPPARARTVEREAEPASSVASDARPAWRQKLEAALVEAVVRLLKAKPEDVDLDLELGEFGFDSISLTGLANHLNRAFGLELMPTLFFEHPTLRRVAEHLRTRHAAELSQVFGADEPASGPRARPAATAGPARPVAPSGLLSQVQAWLVEAVGVLLKVKRADVDLDAEFGEFGFDSISFTGFANHINRAYGLELMPTLFFEQPTVRALARHLVDKHAAALAAKLGLAADEGDAAERASRPAPARAAQRSRRRGRARVTEPVAPEGRGSTLAAQADAIAIIGASARFPGARDLTEFWANLEAGRESIREVPPERWDWRELSDGDAASGVKWGAFIDDVDRFDPLFFGISPREAELIDPQHRLTMMYGWKALEDAGYGPKRLWGSRTGIFVGTTSTGYGEQLLTRAGAGIEGYSATGLVPSVGPNRLSYLLNLHGPSEPIETACSSSLVAMHRAVGSLAAGECDLALAGGVNTLFPTLHVSFGKAGMLSPNGKCRTFSSRADGYVRGEGVGMLVLKRLRDAERDGDHIYALVRGSSENHGGRGQSLTAPNPQAQAELIQDAFRRAGVSPRSVSYIEAHGTGTPLGDPVEVSGLKSAFEALGAEFGEAPQAGYCGLGSVKTNIGHLELAAGVAGVLKVVLQMKHRQLVPSLHCDEVNPYLQLEGSPFYVVREKRAWIAPQDAQGRPWPLRAGVSSFGFGGVNAHVLLEEYVAGREPALESGGRRGATALVVLSAKDAERLRERAAQLRSAIERGELDDERLASAAYTLQVGREAMDHRLAATVASVAELDAQLAGFLEGRSGAPGLYAGEVKRGNEAIALLRDDEDLREAVGKWMQRGKWAKLLELWVKGLDVDWEQLYGESRPRKLSLPTYPFARERCWFDAARRAPTRGVTGARAVLHPLLHANVSVLGEQRYATSLAGDEFFLRDHRVRLEGGAARGVLPGVAYLEMVRAAVEQASAALRRADVLELRHHVWLKPVLAGEHEQLSVALFEGEGDVIEYEVTSRQGDATLTHCQGEALWLRGAAPVRVDVAALEATLAPARVTAARVYAMFTELGFDYGPTHRGIVTLAQGDGQLLAHLRLPAQVEATERDYWLHPSLMDGALQAAACLDVDFERSLAAPQVPFSLESLRVLARCAREMRAWVRHAAGAGHGTKLDVDLLDGSGQVCVQLRGYTPRALSGVHEGRAQRPAAGVPQREFDSDFYRNLLAGIASRDVSVDEAVEIG